MMIVWNIPLVVGIWTFSRSGGFLAVLVTWLLATLVAPHAMKINDKYEITENY